MRLRAGEPGIAGMDGASTRRTRPTGPGGDCRRGGGPWGGLLDVLGCRRRRCGTQQRRIVEARAFSGSVEAAEPPERGWEGEQGQGAGAKPAGRSLAAKRRGPVVGEDATCLL